MAWVPVNREKCLHGLKETLVNLRFDEADLAEFINIQLKEHNSPLAGVNTREVVEALKLLSAQGMGLEIE